MAALKLLLLSLLCTFQWTIEAKLIEDAYIVASMRHTKLVVYTEGGPGELECQDFLESLNKNKTVQAEQNDKEESDYYYGDYGDDHDVDYLMEIDGDVLELTEETLQMLPHVFDPKDVAKSVSHTNNRPEIINYLSDCQLNYVLQWREVVGQLTNQTILKLINNEKLADRLEKIPRSTLAKMVVMRPDIAESLPREFPSRDLVKRLLHDRYFLSQLPLELHAALAESRSFRELLDRVSVANVLAVYPNLPQNLGPEGLNFGSRFLVDPSFLNELSCAVFLNSASDSAFVDRLSAQVLSALARNEHFWSCLPVEIIRQMMKTTHIGKKLNIPDVLIAVTTMSKAKRMDYDVVVNIFRHQFPIFSIAPRGPSLSYFYNIYHFLGLDR